MSLTIYKQKAIKRLLFSLMIVLIYILGSNILIPGIDAQALSELSRKTAGLSFAMSMTGLSIDRLSLFSLGLGPWMSAMIFGEYLRSVKSFILKALLPSKIIA